jgi:hypothetical protein
MAGAMGKYTYTSDDSVSYRIKSSVIDGTPASVAMVSNPGRVTLPHGYHPRHVWVKDDADLTGGRTPTGRRRKITCGTVAATAFVGGASSISLPDYSVVPSVAILWTIEGRIGERRFTG